MRFASASPRSASFLLLAGFVGWSAAFVALYVVLSFGCAYGWDRTPFGPTSLNRAALIAAWALSLAALAGLVLFTVKLFAANTRTGAFLKTAGVALSALALAATVWNFFMVTALSTCL